MSAKTQKRSGGGQKSVSKQRIVFLDYLRAFMPIAVVGIHVCLGVKDFSSLTPDYMTRDYFWLAAITRLLRIAVPIFCMISGAIFLDPRRKFDYKKHYYKTVPKMLLVYLAWSLIYAAIVASMTKGSSDERLMVYIENSISGYWHLWYLKMLIAVYLLVPLLRKIVEDKKVLKIAGYLIVFSFAMTTLSWILNLLVERTGDTGLLKHLTAAFDLSALNVAFFVGVGYAAYFIVGYYLSKARLVKKQRLLLYVIGILGLVMTIVLNVARSRVLGEDYAVKIDAFGDIGLLFWASAIFVWVREATRKKKQTGPVVAFMAKHSLGVYVIHALPILIACKIFAMPPYHLWSMFVIIPGSTLLVYGFSLLVSWLFSKIPLLKKVV